MPGKLPEWVAQHKSKGMEIKVIKKQYYLYERSTVYDKALGRAKKVSGKYMGKITPGGVVAPGSRGNTISVGAKATVLEYGASRYVRSISADIARELRKQFENGWEMIYVVSVLRTIHKIPFKRLAERYRRSYLSVEYPGLNLAGKNLTKFLKDLGEARGQASAFMKACFSGGKYMLFDGTSITSFSEGMASSQPGYSQNHSYDPQVNLLYAFSYGANPAPAYYRVVPGNIKDASALKLTMEEMGIRDIVVVADKAFGYAKNIKALTGLGLKYVVPLKRNSTKYDRQTLKSGTRAAFDGSFLFNGRPVWHYENPAAADGTRIVTYRDSELQYFEERDYMRRIEKKSKGYTQAGLLKKQYEFGIIVLQCNIPGSAREVYEVYKQRSAIEQSFDCLKNVLGQDSSYMHDDLSLEGWCFLNHISLMFSYRIYAALKSADLIKKFSVNDVLDSFSAACKISVDNRWLDSEISASTASLMQSLHFT